MTYEELKINIELNGYENVLPKIGKICLYDHWFIVCDDGDCHLFDRYGNEDDISKVITIYVDMIPKDIKKIVIPNNVISIGYRAFYDCNRLTSITIPNSVMNIGWYVFECCRNLTHMTIPNSVKSIGDHAFYGCRGLTSMTIGNSITNIGWDVFYCCDRLTSVRIDKPIEQVKSMESYPFGIEDESIIKCI